MTTVVVTDPEYRKAVDVFQNADGFDCIPAPPGEEELAEAIRKADARFAIVGVESYRGILYDAIPRGGVIARFGVGHDGIDKALAASRGILCCNTPGVLDDSVAECTLGLMLAAARHTAACAADNRAGHWIPRVGSELAGKTLAVIGCGKIGCKVARIATLGFGMQVVGCDLAPPDADAPIDAFYPEFDDAVAQADFVSLHIPDIPATRNYLNGDRLARMKPSAILINTARGAVVDEDALYDAVAGGSLAGAALDVFKAEPYTPHDPARDLRTLDRVLMTPHIGSSTTEACDRMARAALENIATALAGRVDAMDLIPEAPKEAPELRRLEAQIVNGPYGSDRNK